MDMAPTEDLSRRDYAVAVLDSVNYPDVHAMRKTMFNFIILVNSNILRHLPVTSKP